jgi:hypothetical protein
MGNVTAADKKEEEECGQGGNRNAGGDIRCYAEGGSLRAAVGGLVWTGGCSGMDRRVAPSGEKRNHLEDRLKELMQELGNAINESLSDSDRIAAAMGEIKRAGYDVFLVLEATIGFNKREDAEETEELNSPPENSRRKVGKIKLTSQDQKFLRALKIAIEDEGR